MNVINRVEEEIQRLNGLTLQELRSLLAAEGYKGRVDSVSYCPLARYFVKKFSVLAYVNNCGVKIYIGEVSHDFKGVTDEEHTLGKFLINFDQRLYPELIEPKPKGKEARC